MSAMRGSVCFETTRVLSSVKSSSYWTEAYSAARVGMGTVVMQSLMHAVSTITNSGRFSENTPISLQVPLWFKYLCSGHIGNVLSMPSSFDYYVTLKFISCIPIKNSSTCTAACLNVIQ